MICDEIAAQAIAQTAAGVTALYGACGAKMKTVDHVSGMEARILREISEAAAGLGLEEANAMVVQLLNRYEKPTAAGEAPLGMSFKDCYELSELAPIDEYVQLWERKKADLTKVGLRFA
jgi:hypothetical protein